jgi:hypothetical protein
MASKVLFSEHRGDRYLSITAKLDGRLVGAMTIGWIPAHSGAAFTANYARSEPTVEVTLVYADGTEQDVHTARLPAVRYQSEAYSAGRAYLRHIDARGTIRAHAAKVQA